MSPKDMPILVVHSDSFSMHAKICITLFDNASFCSGNYRTIFSSPMKSDSLILLHFTVVLSCLASSIL